MNYSTQRWAPKMCTIQNSASNLMYVQLSGRVLWAFTKLHEAGATGCATLQTGVPRLAAYVHELRKRGVWIETIKELNRGEFSGYHARYVLRSEAQIGVTGE